LVLLRVGFTIATNCYQLRGALFGGILSAALSVGSRPPGVTWHSTLWSPDFPPDKIAERLPDQLKTQINIIFAHVRTTILLRQTQLELGG